MAVQTLQNAEPIAGYVVKERIGAGGYGEVWSAEAPGGLNKAVKFVYGYLDDVRAAGELKALNRIKEVRHPFLLSLERIEVVDGQLVIVTELAEACLKDRFKACQEEEDLPGIPRDELLVYVGDAADALDYMDANYSLQHLDIKPENLLLVGGRVKVADFGLVKDIHDHTVSLMGGLTPVYAPPEVFDGKPSHFSDQYSLAIVYQELLTGTLPFPGTTAAQLAAQHLHGRPRLGVLPEADRGVIARALSKNPQERFSSCREMVERLREAGQAPRKLRRSGRDQSAKADPTRDTKTTASQKTPTPRTPPGDAATAPMEGTSERPSESHPGVTRVHPVDVGPEPAVITDLPPVEWDREAIQLRPTLFVGIGGAAAATLGRLRRRLYDRFDGLEGLPALRMLLLDTDRKALHAAAEGDDRTALAAADTLALPLRRTQDYRRDSKRFLQWLSRRWLYNIPRSLETEGLRPLGRLALVDHFAQVQEHFREALQAMTDPEASRETAATVGAEFLSESPRVVLVAGISGGTGGGMVLDMAYAARKTLRDLGMADDRISGVLLHATPRKANARDLALVNAYAFLSELNHYGRAGTRYPGDAACELPESEEPPFQDAYLVHLGEELDDQEFWQATDRVAEYLYRDAVTEAGSLLEACREHTRDEAQTALRTFGLHRVGCSASPVADAAAELLCRAVVDRWDGDVDTFRRHRLVEGAETKRRLKKPDSPRLARQKPLESSNIPLFSERCAEALDLDLANLQAKTDAFLSAAIGKPLRAHFTAAVEQFLDRRELSESAGEDELPLDEFVETLDRTLGRQGAVEARKRKPTTAVEKAFVREVNPWAEKRAAELVNWLFQLAETPGAGAQGASAAADWFSQHLRGIEEQARDAAGEIRSQLSRLEGALRTTASGRRRRGRKAEDELQQALLKYALWRAQDFSLRGILAVARTVAGHVAAAAEQFRDWRRELGLLADAFQMPQPLQDEEEEERLDRVSLWVAAALQAQLEDLAGELDEEFTREFLGESQDFRKLATTTGLAGTLPGPLRRAARRVVSRTLQGVNVPELLLQACDDASSPVEAYVSEAHPALVTQCGGARRLLLLTPENDNAGEDAARLQTLLEEQCEAAATSAASPDGDVVFCYEAENVSLERAADAMVHHRPDLPDVAARVRTRVDVPWQTLTTDDGISGC